MFTADQLEVGDVVYVVEGNSIIKYDDIRVVGMYLYSMGPDGGAKALGRINNLYATWYGAQAALIQKLEEQAFEKIEEYNKIREYIDLVINMPHEDVKVSVPD